MWDVKSEQYKHRIARDEALSSIASHFNIPKIEISRKLHNIRSQYSNERTKLRRLATSGSAATVSSKWQHFASLDFLGDSIEARPSKSNISEEPEGEHKEDHISSREPQLRKRKAKKDSFNDLLQLAENQLRKEEDRYDIFGKTVACGMRDIQNYDQKLYAERMINEIIFQARLGTLQPSTSLDNLKSFEEMLFND